MTATLEWELTVPTPEPADTDPATTDPATTEAAATRCLVGGRPHRVTDIGGHPTPGRLCERHAQALAGMLRDIEREAAPVQFLESGKLLANLDPVPSMQIDYNRGGGQLASHLSPARLDVIVHRDQRHGTGRSEDDDDVHAAGHTASTLVVLHTWAQQVRTERHLTRPTTTVRLGWARNPRGPVCAGPCGHDSCGQWITDTIPADPTIRTERDVLTRNLDWITSQPWAGDLYTDIRALRDQLRRANGTQPADPLPGRCPNLLPGKDGKERECGGPLWPVKPLHTSGEDVWTGASPSAIRCAACTRRWQGPSEVARLVLMIEQSRATRGQP